MIATATTTTNHAFDGPWSSSHGGAGSQDTATPAPPSITTAPEPGVKKPIMSEIPLAIASEAAIHDPIRISTSPSQIERAHDGRDDAERDTQQQEAHAWRATRKGREQALQCFSLARASPTRQRKTTDRARIANPRDVGFSRTTFVVDRGRARRSCLQFDDSATHGDRHRFRAVRGAQLVHDVLDVDLYGFL